MKTKAIALLAIILVSCESQNGELITPDKDETINPKEEIVQPKFTVIDTVISGYRPMIENLEVPVTVADLDYTITENGKPFEQSQACYLDVLRTGDKHLIVLNGAGGGVNLSPRVIVIASKEYRITLTQQVITQEQIEKYNRTIGSNAQTLTLVDAGFYGEHNVETVLYKEFGSPVTNVIQDNGETTTQHGYFSSLKKSKKGDSATTITLNIEANTTSRDRVIEIFNVSSYNHYTTITQQGVK